MKKESVWDYPRPPKVEYSNKNIEIYLNNKKIVDTDNSFRVLETSHPPVYYISKKYVTNATLQENSIHTHCEFKGRASYFDIKIDGKIVKSAAWTYHNPNQGYEEIKDKLAFYPSKMDKCQINGEVVKAQDGDFYGGWITSNITGPFKGSKGTEGW
jgi:uncharacterized protein (DUF427 family)